MIHSFLRIMLTKIGNVYSSEGTKDSSLVVDASSHSDSMTAHEVKRIQIGTKSLDLEITTRQLQKDADEKDFSRPDHSNIETSDFLKKWTKVLKTSVFVFITIIAVGLLVKVGSVCISK